MEGFGARYQHQKQAAFFSHHGSPRKWRHKVGLTVGNFCKLRSRVFWAAFGHVVELGLETELVTILERCRGE